MSYNQEQIRQAAEKTAATTEQLLAELRELRLALTVDIATRRAVTAIRNGEFSDSNFQNICSYCGYTFQGPYDFGWIGHVVRHVFDEHGITRSGLYPSIERGLMTEFSALAAAEREAKKG